MQRRVYSALLRRNAAAAIGRRSFWHITPSRAFRIAPLFDVPLPGLPPVHIGGLFDQFADMQGFGPRLHVHETEAALEMEFEVPRYKPSELQVTVKGDVLTVYGKRAVQKQDGRVVLFQESPLAEFTRSFRIPRAFDLSKHQLGHEHGVFSIKIPRVPVEKPQPLTVEPTAEAKVDTPPTAAADTTPKSGDAVAPTEKASSQIDSISKMRWPPTIKANDTAQSLEYTCSLPPFIGKDNLKLRLDRGTIDLSVEAAHRVDKKDAKGNVVYESTQNVSYSTALAVPNGTSVKDISTKFDNNVLTVKVNKHANPSQTVPIA